jgi:hypothetical protein
MKSILSTILKDKEMLTEAEMNELYKVINRVWQDVAADLASCDQYYWEDDEYEESGIYSRYDVANLCLDADRWRGKGKDAVMEVIMEKLHVQGWNSKEWEAQIDIVLPDERWSAW